MRAVSVQLTEAVVGAAIAQRVREACVAPTPQSVAACAQFLLRVNFISQAEMLFQALAQNYPSASAGAIGLARVAMERKFWVRALRRWSDVIAVFPRQNPAYFLTAQANVLLELERTDEAVAILDGVVCDFANMPFGYAALARLAMRQRHWSEALECWDDVLARFPQHYTNVSSRIGRASTLLELARYAEAEASLREIIQEEPWLVWARLNLVQTLVLSGRPEQAFQEIETEPFARAAIPALMKRRIEILMSHRRFDAARVVFADHLRRTVGLESIISLFNVAPQLYERWQCMEAWLELRRRLDELPLPVDPEDRPPFEVMRARIQLAFRDHAGFLNSFHRSKSQRHFGELEDKLAKVAAAIEDRSFPDSHKPKVFGIGLSKTGTTSLAAALSALGFNTVHWQNPLTCEIISDADSYLFDALTDAPVCLAFEKYYYLFPASKFIYTVRPFRTWRRSILGHFKRHRGISGFRELKRSVRRPKELRFGSRHCEINQTLYGNYANLREAYETYDRRVRTFFRDKPKERFLVFDVFAGHGWFELCTFLDTKPPAIPFPFENRASQRRE